MKKVKKTVLSLILFLVAGFITSRNVYADLILEPLIIEEYDIWYYFALVGIILGVVILSIVILRMLCNSKKDEKEN